MRNPESQKNILSSDSEPHPYEESARNQHIYRRRQPVFRPDLKGRPVELWMVRWIDALNCLGGQAYLRDLRRATNSSKGKPHSEMALARLEATGVMRFEPEGRRVLVTIAKRPPQYLQPQLKPKKRRHPPRSRGRTPWFEDLLRRREEEQNEIGQRQHETGANDHPAPLPFIVPQRPAPAEPFDLADPFGICRLHRKPGR